MDPSISGTLKGKKRERKNIERKVEKKTRRNKNKRLTVAGKRKCV